MKKYLVCIYCICISMQLMFANSVAPHASLKLNNIKINNSSMEFSIQLNNDGNQNLSLAGLSIGLNISGIDGDLSNYQLEYVEGSGNVEMMKLNKCKIRTFVSQGTIHAAILNYAVDYYNSLSLLPSQSVTLARYKLVSMNSVSNFSNLRISFEEETKIGFTSTNLAAFIGLDGSVSIMNAKNKLIDNFSDQNISIKDLNKESLHFKIFSNPVSEVILLSISSNTVDKVEISIVNLQGQRLKNIESDVNIGSNQIKIPISEMASGIYLLSVKQGFSTITQKFVIN